MPKTSTFELNETKTAELDAAFEQWIAEMKRANGQMKKDQEQINRLKVEAQAVARHTRAILEQLEATV